MISGSLYCYSKNGVISERFSTLYSIQWIIRIIRSRDESGIKMILGKKEKLPILPVKTTPRLSPKLSMLHLNFNWSESGYILCNKPTIRDFSHLCVALLFCSPPSSFSLKKGSNRYKAVNTANIGRITKKLKMHISIMQDPDEAFRIQ